MARNNSVFIKHQTVGQEALAGTDADLLATELRMAAEVASCM